MNRLIVKSYFEFRLNGVNASMNCQDDQTQFAISGLKSISAILAALYLLTISISWFISM